MKQKTSKYLVIFAISIFLIACKSTASKMNDFVSQWNEIAKSIPSTILQSTKAKAIYEKKIVKIDLVTNYSLHDINEGMMEKALPAIFATAISKEPLCKQLVDEGVDFEVIFYSKDFSDFSTIVINKKKLAELLNDNEKSDQKIASDQKKSNLSPDVLQMLSILNKNLPHVDKTTGTSILKIEANEKNELLYIIEVPQDIAISLKDEDAKQIMKDEILRSSTLRQSFSAVKRLGLNVVKFKYQDKKGNFLTEIIFTEKDLL